MHSVAKFSVFVQGQSKEQQAAIQACAQILSSAGSVPAAVVPTDKEKRLRNLKKVIDGPGDCYVTLARNLTIKWFSGPGC